SPHPAIAALEAPRDNGAVIRRDPFDRLGARFVVGVPCSPSQRRSIRARTDRWQPANVVEKQRNPITDGLEASWPAPNAEGAPEAVMPTPVEPHQWPQRKGFGALAHNFGFRRSTSGV